jgi:hypothetical protein
VQLNESQHDFDDVTVVILSRNRPNYLLNLAKYWSLSNIKILICDGSDNPLPSYDFLNNINLTKFNKVSLSERIQFASSSINTKFSFLQGDDDLIPYESVTRAKNFLNVHSSFDGIWSEPLEFNSSFLYPDLGERSYRSFSNDDHNDNKRAVDYLRRSYDMHFHGFFFSEPFKRALSYTSYSLNITDDEWMIFCPIMFEVAMSLNCRTQYFKDFHYLKRRIEEVRIFSRKSRKLESHIQEEILLSWKLNRIQSLWEMFVPQWLESMNRPTLEKEILEKELVEYGRKKQEKGESVKGNLVTSSSNFSERIRNYLLQNSPLYPPARFIYRVTAEIKHYFKGNRVKWTKLKDHDEYYPAPHFVNVFQLYSE